MNQFLEDIKNLKLPPLKKGAHIHPLAGLCAMEMVAFIERLPHSDQPECTCLVIAAYVRTINDYMPDDQRQRLMPFLPRLVGTVDKDLEIKRAKFLAERTMEAANSHQKCASITHAKQAVWCAYVNYSSVHASSRAAMAFCATAAWDEALEALDGVLKIGQLTGFTNYSTERVKELCELVVG